MLQSRHFRRLHLQMKRMNKRFLTTTLVLILGYSAAVQADWNWPWENNGHYQESDDGFGDFLGGFFGGERTRLDLEFELEMQMRYDMQYAGNGSSYYYGYNPLEGYNGQVPYYSQVPSTVPVVPESPAPATARPAEANRESYRDAIEAQRRMVEQMAERQQQTVQRFDQARDKVASRMQEATNPETNLLDMQERREAAFREMQERHNSYQEEREYPAEPSVAAGVVQGY
jgi:hypothetical protein